MRERLQWKQTVNVFQRKNTIPEATILYKNNSIFVSLILTFYLAGNVIVYTPIQGTNRESYYLKTKNADSGGKQILFHPFLPSWTASFPSFDGKSSAPIRPKRTSKWLFPRRHNE